MPRARSVAELLPQRFEALSLADIETILDESEDESLYLEWKSDPSAKTIAKSCAAFANALGGLFIIGVDKTRKIVGVENPPREVQVLIKDVLRSHVLPMPSFSARELPLGNGRSLLLVMLEESSTTPHLLAHTGVIYVRNPGSSDPVPIANQTQLLELITRGRESRDNAERRAYEINEQHRYPDMVFSLALAPTGAASDVVEGLYDGSIPISALDEALRGLYNRVEFDEEAFPDPYWSLRSVTRDRIVNRQIRHFASFTDSLSVFSDCSVRFQRYLSGKREEPQVPYLLQLNEEVRPWLKTAVERGRELVLAFGGHGDLRLLFHVSTALYRLSFAGQGIGIRQSNLTGGDASLGFWISLDSDPARDESIYRRATAGLLRSVGVAPFAE